MKLISKLVQGYGWGSAWDFILSLSPSVKYHAAPTLLFISWVSAWVEMLLGIKGATALAFCVLALVELLTGIYASLKVRKENYESFKIGRFTIKLVVILVCIYVLNAFAHEFKDSEPIVGGAFEYARIFMFAYSAQEYLVSVLENVGQIGGKDKTFLITRIKEAFTNLFNKFLGGNP